MEYRFKSIWLWSQLFDFLIPIFIITHLCILSLYSNVEKQPLLQTYHYLVFPNDIFPLTTNWSVLVMGGSIVFLPARGTFRKLPLPIVSTSGAQSQMHCMRTEPKPKTYRCHYQHCCVKITLKLSQKVHCALALLCHEKENLMWNINS